MLTRVLLLRHAESANHAVFHGAQSDIGLSERGHSQARRVAAYLAGLRPDVIVSSGMRRALDTAGPIATASGKEVHIEPLLHERRVGVMSGKPRGTPEDP